MKNPSEKKPRTSAVTTSEGVLRLFKGGYVTHLHRSDETGRPVTHVTMERVHSVRVDPKIFEEMIKNGLIEPSPSGDWRPTKKDEKPILKNKPGEPRSGHIKFSDKDSGI